MKSLIIIFLASAFISTAIISCKKTLETGPPINYDSTSTTYFLDSTIYIMKDTNLITGVFHYSVSNQNLPVFKPGDYFIEPRNFGYIRKIDNVKMTNSDLYLYSEQATIGEAFKRYGDFRGSFSIPVNGNPFLNSLKQLKKSKVAINSVSKINGSSATLGNFPGFTISISGINVTFKTITLNFNPVFNTGFNARGKSFSLGVDSTNLSYSYSVSLQKSAAGNMNISDTFHLQNYFPADVSKLFTRIPIEVPGSYGLPIIGDVNIDLLFVINYTGSNTISDEFDILQQRQFAMNLNYLNNNLDANFQYTSPLDSLQNKLNDNNGLETSFSLIPVFRISYYNIPVANMELVGQAKIGIESNSTATSWDELGLFSVQGTGDFSNSVLGFYSNEDTKISSIEMNDSAYVAPSKIIPSNSNPTSGKAGDKIPYTVQVADNYGQALKFPTTVYYSTDNGSWDNTQLFSSLNNGSVTNNFIIGAGTSHVQISVKDANNSIKASLSTTFVSDTTNGIVNYGLYAVGQFPVPGAVPGFNGYFGNTFVAGGVLTTQQAPGIPGNINVKIFDASNNFLYVGNGNVTYYGHNSPVPTFIGTDSTYAGAQYYAGQGWGCMLPAGYDTWYDIGGVACFSRRSSDNKNIAIMLPSGYCLFKQ
jgi:hypothetical protein